MNKAAKSKKIDLWPMLLKKVLEVLNIPKNICVIPVSANSPPIMMFI